MASLHAYPKAGSPWKTGVERQDLFAFLCGCCLLVLVCSGFMSSLGSKPVYWLLVLHSECLYSFIFIFHYILVICSEKTNLHVFGVWIIFPVSATCCNIYVENKVLSTCHSPFPYFLGHFLEQFIYAVLFIKQSKCRLLSRRWWFSIPPAHGLEKKERTEMGALKRQKRELGEPLGTWWLLREVNLVLCSAAVLQQEGTRAALDTVTGMSCELKSFPEVKENGRSECND